MSLAAANSSLMSADGKLASAIFFDWRNSPEAKNENADVRAEQIMFATI
jgi:hypothetical protein